jgi:hypothetical protein
MARPPYVLEKPMFRFARLAAQAGRSPVGGGREVALAAYLTARLAHDCLPERGVDREARSLRAAAAATWLSALTLASPVRSAFSDIMAASGGRDPAEVGVLLRRVIAVTAQTLESGARLELERLAAALEAQPLAGT